MLLREHYIVSKDTNINEIPPKIQFKLQHFLDNSVNTARNWRALIESIPSSPFSAVEVEKFALSYQRRESPTGCLLHSLGSGGKTVEHLVSYLWRIEHEDALKLLITHIPTEITKHPVPRLDLTEGDELRLECDASGLPFPKFQWFHENNEVPHAVDKVLIIQSLKVVNTGRYCCRVHNGTQTRFTNKTFVTVEPRKGYAPRIITEPSNVCASLAQPVQFTCMAEGCPEPEYQWFRNNVPLKTENKPVLNIPQVGLADKGDYYCIATNNFGRAQTGTVLLRIGTVLQEKRYTATDKVALLIGNSVYTNNSKLGGVPKDIEDLSRVFNEMGFKVMSLLNLSRADMKYYIDYFCSLLDQGVYGVFYFGGHGFDLEDQTYLMAVDAHVGFKITDTICAQEVQSLMQQKDPALCVLILDVCRKVHSEAIKVDKEKLIKYKTRTPGNTVYFYATSSGCRAYDATQNGVMWYHLSKFLPNQDLNVDDVFQKTKYSIGEDPRPDVIEQQFPTLHSVLRYKLKFNDPIDYRGHTKVYNIRSLRWAKAQDLPKALECTDEEHGIQVIVFFGRVFSNQLRVCTEVKCCLPGPGYVAWLTNLTNTVACSRVSRDRHNPARMRQEIDDLQRLKGPLTAKIIVMNNLTGERFVLPHEIDLGYPLVAQLRCSEQSDQCAGGDLPQNAPPHSVLMYSRIPTESSDLDCE